MPRSFALVDEGSLIPFIILVFAIALITHLSHSLGNLTKLPSQLDWADQPHNFLPKARACIRQLFTGLQSLDSGYSQYNENGKSFVMPDLGFGPIVILPHGQIPWLIAQPDNVLSARAPQGKRIAIQYTMPFIDFSHDSFHVDIRKLLTPNLDKLQSIIFEGLRKNVDVVFGTEQGSWREINLYSSMETIMFSALNHVAVGPPLCSDSRYLKSLSNLLHWLGGSGLVAGQLMPPFLKPVVGYLAAIPIHFYERQTLSHLVPIIKQRLNAPQDDQIKQDSQVEDSKCLLSWMIATLIEGDDRRALTPEVVAMNILFISLAGIFPNILTSTNLLLDILTSPQTHQIYSTLHNEAASIFKSPQDWTSPTSLTKLILTDSAIKETLRMSPLLSRGMVREVVARDGIDLPDDGCHLPQGTWLGVAIDRIHHDERFYTDPDIYDAFRFANDPASASFSHTNNLSTTTTQQKPLGLTTATDTYLPWGYGRHACPGRWFVATQLKILLAYITLHYEIQSLEGGEGATKRPPNSRIGDSIVPPRDVMIKVRRRG